MEKNLDFLNYMFKNAKMGIIGIDDVYPKVKAKELKKLLQKQRNEYDNICSKAIELLKKHDAEVEDLNVMAKIGSSFVSSIEIAKNHSDSTIAKLMIEGTNKGIIEINEKLNNIPNIDKETKKIALKLLKIEQYNLTELKKYL